MDDKFILAGMHDSKSKEIADILSNKTARKILDYLAENDSSETDISRNLNLPLSTVHYNVQKMLENKIIEVKDFFWSEKGNKINIYRVARKPIIIAPKYYRGYETLKSIIPAIIVGALFLVAIFTILYNIKSPQPSQDTTPIIPGGEIIEKSDLRKFSSLTELRDFIKDNMESSGLRFLSKGEATVSTLGTIASGASASEAAPQAAEEFSTTNIQVEGVDEADIVKNDGEYIYAVSGDKVFIVDAFPAENAKILSSINISGTANEIFINENRLVIFGSEEEEYLYVMGDIEAKEVGADVVFPRYSSPKTFIRIYDVEDKENPILVRNLSFRGSYFDSRMIGNYVYAIVNLPVINYNNIVMPVVYSGDEIREVKASEIYYFDIPDTSYTFSTINAINLNDDESDISSKTFMMGYAQNMYVSADNIYLTYMKRLSNKYYYEKLIDEVYLPLLPEEIASKVKEIRDSNYSYYEKMQKIGEILQDYSETLEAEARLKFQNDIQDAMEKLQEEIARETEKTVIHRISINKDTIKHEAEGEVPGNVLNQFSMDEYEGNFRIATTTGNVWSGNSMNHLYVLDEKLKIIGKVEDLAKGERIYSARFLGNRAYLVTFKKIDPLFVMDLSNPEEPKVLGYLKITGYSDYLHPYDENHIIGVGKETLGGDEHFSYYQGIKISLFDVSDVENPVELGKIEIGDRGTDSYALRDHKAFLFDKKRSLLVIPVLLAEINRTQYGENIPDWAYGTPVWQGAYVLNVSLEGISVRGNITHFENQTESWGFYDERYSVKRSLYMENTLYTVSSRMIKMNSLDNLEEINKIILPYKEEPIIYRAI